MAERETWTTDEFGSSHEGSVGVLLADGTVPGPAFFPMSSGGEGQSTSQWSVYDGFFGLTPKAHALRAECSCGWTGTEHPLDWEQIGEQELRVAARDLAEECETEWWDGHTITVEKSAIAVPEEITDLVRLVAEKIEKLAQRSPLAAVRAARLLEVAAVRTGYWPAHDARAKASPEEAAAALGLNEDDTRHLLARFGNWSPYG
ncbi:hypothetical protein ACIQ9P_00875 [Kitasatospora sp. NPDC094019]|uniref:hypothetical protein n=1 Tax=Kitasatospora sp. NPDC094019 TaxID=3364091 RepID=UPI0038037E41